MAQEPDPSVGDSEREGTTGEVHRDRARSDLLVELGTLLTRAHLEVSAVLDTVVRRLAETLHDTAAVMVVSDDGDWLDFAALHFAGPTAATPAATASRSAWRVPLAGSVVERAIRSGEVLFVPDVLRTEEPKNWVEGQNPVFRQALEDFPIRSMIAVPLIDGAESFGVLVVSRSITETPFTDDDVQLARTMADRALPFIGYARRDAALRASEERFRRLTEEAPDAIFRYRLGPDRGLEYVNSAMEELIGMSAERLYADPDVLHTVVHPDDRSMAEAFLARPALSDRHPLILRWVCADDRVRWVEQRLVGVADASGTIVALEGVARDITDLKRVQDELTHEASHDHLTGLANRQLFVRELGNALIRLDRRSGSVGVVFFDLDRFKAVNDNLGHAAGDVLLRAVAGRLSDVLRPTDFLARLGGDEFGILVPEASTPEATVVVADRVQRALREPFDVFGREVVTAASIGIAHSERPDESADDLLRHADAAMYQAKAAGGGRFEVYDESLRATIHDRLTVEAALRRALERAELRVHYQPIVDATTGAVVAVEALLRWQREDRLVEAAEFIHIAEDTGLVAAVGEWVIAQARRDQRTWPTGTDGSALRVHVNLSSGELYSDRIEMVVAEHFPDGGICPEIAESVMLVDAEVALDRLGRLRRRGAGVALDNFGTGYASLAALKRLDVDAIKIDRSLIEHLGVGGGDEAIVVAVTSMARAMGITAVAAGVETDRQLARLRALGCELAQGYLLGAPVSAEELGRVGPSARRW